MDPFVANVVKFVRRGRENVRGGPTITEHYSEGAERIVSLRYTAWSKFWLGLLTALVLVLLAWVYRIDRRFDDQATVEADRWIEAAKLQGAYEHSVVKAFAKVKIDFDPATGESKPLEENP